MPLHGYGLLIGAITASRPQRSGSPHWLLMVQPAAATHPPYRVAVNLQSTEAGSPPEVQFQALDVETDGTTKAKALVRRLKRMGATENFLVADGTDAVPRLDFVRGSLLDLDKFLDVPSGENPFRSKFEEALEEAAAADQTGGALAAVFGTGYPINQRTGVAQPTGFEGIDNIHMNQGSLNTVHGAVHYIENGPNQDGGLIFLLPSGARGFFMKFHNQTLRTGDDGNPTITGVDKLDGTSTAVRHAIMPPLSQPRGTSARPTRAAPGATRRGRATSEAVAPSGGSPVASTPPAALQRGFVFADPNPADADETFKEDDDRGLFKTPFVMAYSKGKTRGPVPTPHGYPTMSLTDVTGDRPPGYVENAAGKSIVFDMAGDTGAPSEQKLTQELKVTELITRNATSVQPAFLFHVGDVVYFYGEEDYYYSQFYKPFQDYPAPIFAIPGNHDGITYNKTMISLDPFKSAFCAPAPARWEGSGGILRTSMAQPGVYFTLDAPLVSIIGLYSNCGESLGWLDEQQLLFLYHELVRLKAKREADGRAVILAIHHCPRWFPGQAQPDQTSGAIDRTCAKAEFWPDAVVSGHAHIYQRIVRQDGGRDVPYIIAGAGGYAVSPREELAKDYMAELTKGGNRLARFLPESGYVRVRVSQPAHDNPTLSFEYNSVKQTSNEPDDVCAVDLVTRKLTVG
jgi:uncharacterized protein YukJ